MRSSIQQSAKILMLNQRNPLYDPIFLSELYHTLMRRRSLRLNNAISEIIVGENAAAALRFLVLCCNAVEHGWIKLKNP